MRYIKRIKILIIIPLIIGLAILIVILQSNLPLDIKDIIVIYPSFTEAAYNPNGFYTYYSHGCDIKCLTVHFSQNDTTQFSSSRNAFKMFKAFGFKLIDDSELDSNPEILKNYKKVIVLHNEYVTQKEFDAITNHPNVLYLYPNSLYAEVRNNHKGTITLLKGHGYKKEANGFDWYYDNTRFEFDRDCKNLKFYHIPNGRQINCYPEWHMNNVIIGQEIMR